MASIICKVSAQFTQNIFQRLHAHQQGYLDQSMLEQALVGLSRAEVSALFEALDRDADQRISPYELNLAILEWLSASDSMPVATAFSSLLILYGIVDEEGLRVTADVRPHTASAHVYAQTGYAR